jgi:hypothetical protein
MIIPGPCPLRLNGGSSDTPAARFFNSAVGRGAAVWSAMMDNILIVSLLLLLQEALAHLNLTSLSRQSTKVGFLTSARPGGVLKSMTREQHLSPNLRRGSCMESFLDFPSPFSPLTASRCKMA